MNESERAAYRAFIRANHPDRGGDPEVFVEGMARFTRSPSSQPDPDDARYDAPIEIVKPLPVPVRVAVALIRTVRWHRSRRVD
ncbi:hypothetical protein [Pseudonocardia sp. TRM90224]|uniref:hypothetical protein n=1 Tax=Pseudonocardia sp. TRM90224 TaxID=2812678 RepID=UPI001E5E8AA8|nr:hypothetical protein [Pseudonocardia sp. TRM90224]